MNTKPATQKMRKPFIATLISLLCLTACDNFLNVVPVGKTYTSLAFSTIEGMRTARSGMYYKMYELYSSECYVFADLAANTIILNHNSAISDRTKQIYDYEPVLNQNGYWGFLYEIIANINQVIAHQPALIQKYPERQSELEGIKGEALFLRAFCHFALCNFYAQAYNYSPDASHPGIIIVTRNLGPSDKLARSSVKEVYEQIVADLHEADKFLEGRSSTSKYYAGQQAVQALLSRVYLYMEDWEKAAAYATRALQNTKLARGEDYLQMFTHLNNKETEVIFRLNGLKNDNNLLIRLFSMQKDGQGKALPPPALVDKTLSDLLNEHSGDIRITGLMRREVNTEGNTYFSTEKFNIKDNQDPQDEHINPILLRLSELYLNRAEAYLNMKQEAEAAADLIQILARGLQQDPAGFSLSYGSSDELRNILRKERTKELCFEGHLLFDLKRWKQDMRRSPQTTSPVHYLPYPNNRFLLPIPEREMRINPNISPNPDVNN